MPQKDNNLVRRRRQNPSSFKITVSWQKIALLLLFIVVGYIAWLDYQVSEQFEGKRWSLPARVYARPLELYVGLQLEPHLFRQELTALGYRLSPSVRRPGEFTQSSNEFRIHTRSFLFWDGVEVSKSLRINISENKIISLKNDKTGAALPLVRLEPLEIGSIHTARQEDRILLQIEEVPNLLIQSLMVIEDRGFYEHYGISPPSIARAMMVNLRSGKVVQGGSTLTQQLVKNFFLSNERSLRRKLNEAIMSLLLEVRYGKDEILEAYINEIYLSQDGQRPIHGFGLASQFLFQRPLRELTTEQIALLVATVKGPSYYDPRRRPERAMKRRNLVLQVMKDQGIISDALWQKSRAQPLGVAKPATGTSTRFPGFLDLVRRQLRRDYQEKDLVSEGLKIFTTLDPQTQWSLQKALGDRVKPMLETYPDMQGAGLVTQTANGEVLALIGGQQAGFAGFNRALNAKRPVGSLIKPAVFLTALEDAQHYSLATFLDDSPLEIEQHGKLWSPGNYDKESHDNVMLYKVLARSYNIATARLGLQMGVDRVIETLRRLKVEQPLKPYPSLLLGAVDMSPIDVARLYQSFASNGYYIPLRSIREILDESGEPLKRYELKIERVIEPRAAYLLHRGLQTVVEGGTARFLNSKFNSNLGLAGKTGTTNDLRDSWYAGYDGKALGVIWMGRDGNQSMGLTGSSGALRVWSDLYGRTGINVNTVAAPEGIEIHSIDRTTGGLADSRCSDTVQLAFNTDGVFPEPELCLQ